jgi:hypothetical protein
MEQQQMPANGRCDLIPSYIKMEFDSPLKFKRILPKFLHENFFYSLNEYLEFKKN